MKSTLTLLMLPLQTEHASVLLRSDGGRRALLRTIRHAKARGVVLQGWHAKIRETLHKIRRLHPKLTIALALDASEWGRFGSDSGGEPLLCVVRTPIDADGLQALFEFRRKMTGAREPLRRYTLHPGLPCLLDDWQLDVRIQYVGEAPQRVFKPACAGCAVLDRCPGPPHGTPVKPVPAALSNQFDLIEAAGNTGPDELMVVVKDKDGRRQFCASPGAVGVAAVELAVARGQVYLDVSTEARLTDFARETRLLAATEAGDWQALDGDPFAREEVALAAVLDRIEGVVVDIGAGPVRYVERLQAAIDAGVVRYVAVEPDGGHIAAVQGELRGGLFVKGVGEHLPLVSDSVDVAMMLRSFNHLRDPAQAISEAARVVKPGGQLIAVDNVVFGLCRSVEQIERARAISTEQTPFEHFRNVNGDEAAKLIADDERWQIERCEPVRAGTANQWLVTARRRN